MEQLSTVCQKFQERSTSLSLLNMSGVGMGSSGMKRLLESCSSTSASTNHHVYQPPMVCWWLQDNGLYPACAESLASIIQLSPALKFLYLECNSLGNEGSRAVAEASFKKLQVCSLGANNIGPQGARHIAEQLIDPRCVLETLILDSNYLGDEGACIIANALKVNKSLKVLDLRYNFIRKPGMVALRDVLIKHNTTLQILHLEEEVDEACLARQPRKRKTLRPPPVTFRNSKRVCKCERCNLQSEMAYYLAMNRAGRHSLANLQLDISLWPRILAKSILRERPDVLSTR